MMIGARSRDAPRRASPKAAPNLLRFANGMDSYCNLIALKIFLFIKMPLLHWSNGRQTNPHKSQILVGLSQSKCQSVDRAGIVAPQNLHFTGFLFWSEETIWPLLHAGHMRLSLKRLRRIADIKNGFKSLTPLKCFVLSTHNMRHNSGIPNFQAAKDNVNSFAIFRIPCIMV